MNSEDAPPSPRLSAGDDESGIIWTARRQGVGMGCIVIVGIFCTLLVAGYFNPFSRIGGRGPKTAAQSVCQTVLNAVEQFHLDRGHVPLLPGLPTGGDFDTDTSGTAGMINVLKGCDPAQNPSQTDYLGEIKEAKTLNGSRHVDGIFWEQEKVIALFDPWGLPYHMRLDGDHDGSLDDPAHPGIKLHRHILIWSAGKDGDFTTWPDNVTSWPQ